MELTVANQRALLIFLSREIDGGPWAANWILSNPEGIFRPNFLYSRTDAYESLERVLIFSVVFTGETSGFWVDGGVERRKKIFVRRDLPTDKFVGTFQRR